MISTVRATLVAALAAVTVSCGGGGSSPPAPPPPPPPGVNNPPAFSSSSAIRLPETVSAVVVVLAVDPEGQAITYGALGGPDAARFTFNTANREIRFVTPPDFEAPADAGADNIYDISITASDGVNTVTQNITVSITNVDDNFRVRRIASGLSSPIFVTGLPDGSGRIVVVERAGRIRVINPVTGAASPDFLNIAGVDTTGEKGLLSIAFSNNYATDRTFYVHMNPTSANVTEIRQYKAPAAPDVADPSSANTILVVPQPAGSNFTNHKGGFLAIDPGNRLLIGMGDGGSTGDPLGNAQNPNVLLGKILRIDPTLDAFPGDPDRDYSIPSTNPFASAGGSPEIFWMGVRNPFRGSIDVPTNSLLIGDVGQGVVEEVDRSTLDYTGPVLNYGWNRREGTQPYNGGADDPNFVRPVAEYGHGSSLIQGNSITGGVVYRGPIAALQGQYVFADFISENIWTVDVGSLTVVSTPPVPFTVPSSAFVNRNVAFLPDVGTIDQIVAIGTDTLGSLYFVDLGGEVFRLEPGP